MTIVAPRTYVAPITPSPRFAFFTNFSADIDLVALGGAPCASIVVLSAGAISLLPHDPLPNTTTQTSPSLPNGTPLGIVADKILSSGTTISAALVMW